MDFKNIDERDTIFARMSYKKGSPEYKDYYSKKPEKKEIKERIKELKELGVEIEVCLWCSDSYNVTAKYEEIDIKPIYMGEPLTKYLKENIKVLTF